MRQFFQQLLLRRFFRNPTYLARCFSARIDNPTRRPSDESNQPSQVADLLPFGSAELAKTARYIVESMSISEMWTFDSKGSERPLFASPMPYVTCEDAFYRGTPIFFLHDSEKHAKLLETLPHTSILIYPSTPKDISPTACGLPKVLLKGDVRTLSGEFAEDIRRKYLQKFPVAEKYCDFNAGSFRYLDLASIVIRGSTIEELACIEPPSTDFNQENGQESENASQQLRVRVPEYREAVVDEAAVFNERLCKALNEHFAAQLLRLIGAYTDEQTVAQYDGAFIYLIDSVGFEVMAYKSDRNGERTYAGFKVPYDTAITQEQEWREQFEIALSAATSNK